LPTPGGADNPGSSFRISSATKLFVAALQLVDEGALALDGEVTLRHRAFGWGGSGMVSTARDMARFLRALLGGELLPPARIAEMMSTVASDWEESDRYGLGIEEVSSIGEAESHCGAAWGHFGFSTGYTTVALASKTGDRQVVVMFNSHPMSEEVWGAVGRLTWACYCA
jgi:CubicO group peptidase (beta-lactamase class C family)